MKTRVQATRSLATSFLITQCLLLWSALVSAAAAQDQLGRQAAASADSSRKGGYVLPEQPPLSAEAQDTLQRINVYRAAGASCGGDRMAAVAPLVWSVALEQAAIKHSRDMAARRDMSHTGGDGSRMRDRVARESYRWSSLGENVSAGYGTVVAGLAGWMASPGHCRNMMSPSYREVGVGAASAPGDSYGWYRTMVLASP